MNAFTTRARAFAAPRVARFKSTVASEGVVGAIGTYAGPVKLMHWTMGGSVLGCFAYVNMAQQTTDKKLKGDYMFLHKSYGTCVFVSLSVSLCLSLSLFHTHTNKS